MQIVEIPESNVWPVLDSLLGHAFSSQAEPEVVDQRVRECSVVARGDCLTGGPQNCYGWLSRILRGIVGGVILVVPAHEQAVGTRAIEVVINLRYRGVQTRGIRRRETEAANVEPIGVGARARIWHGELLKESRSLGVRYKRIYARSIRAGALARAQRIHLRYLCRPDRVRARRSGPRLRFPLHRVSRALRRCCARIKDHTVAEVCARYVALLLLVLRQPLSFVGSEEKQAVSLDRPAQRTAKRIADNFSRYIR